MATVLVVDDDPQIRDIIRAVLGEAGFAVVEANNGFDALQVLEKRPVDLMVLDIFMPHLGGLGLLENLPARWKGIPVIAMSGGADREASEPLQRAQRLGASRILAKPFKVEELVQAATELAGPAPRPRPTSG